ASMPVRRRRSRSPARLADGAAVVEVRDDDVGVSPGNAQRIFDPFFTTKREAGGTDLGLAIAQRRGQAFGGELLLEETERGALFRIRLKPAYRSRPTRLRGRAGVSGHFPPAWETFDADSIRVPGDFSHFPVIPPSISWITRDMTAAARFAA